MSQLLLPASSGPPGPPGPQGLPGTPGTGGGGAIHYEGAGDYLIDVPAINEYYRQACLARLPMRLSGIIELGWGEVGSNPVPDYYEWGNPNRPVFNAIDLIYDNGIIDGSAAIIRFAPIPWRTNEPGKYGLKPKYVGFGSMPSDIPRTHNNLEIRGCTFEYDPPSVQAIVITSVGNVTIHHNKFHNPGIEYEVTLTEQTDLGVDGLPTHHLLVSLPPDHGLLGMPVVAFKAVSTGGAPLPVPDVEPAATVLKAGFNYYGKIFDEDDGPGLANKMKVSASDILRVAGVVTAEGLVPTPATIVAHKLTGFAIHIDNCDEVHINDNICHYGQQFVFTNYCRGFHCWHNDCLHITEAFDVQTAVENASFVGNTFARFYNEADCIDVSNGRHVLIANNSYNEVRAAFQIYGKNLSQSYAKFNKYGTVRLAEFHQSIGGAPGRVTIPIVEGAPLTNIYEGLRIWFEYHPETLGIPDHGQMFPGETAPGEGDGDVQKYTTYQMSNVDMEGQAFSLKLETSHAHPPEATGPDIIFSTSGSLGVIPGDPDAVPPTVDRPGAGCITHFLPDTPADVKMTYDVLVIGNVAANIITDPEDIIYDPADEPDEPDPERITWVGGRIFLIGNRRELRPGIDRGQGNNGLPYYAERVRLINNSFDGGRVAWVLECKDLEIDGLYMTNMNPGFDIDGFPREALLLQQSILTDESVAQSILTGKARNVIIKNCQGRAVTIYAPGDFVFEHFTIDGHNLGQNVITPAAFSATRLDWKKGLKQFGHLTFRNPAMSHRATFESAAWTAGIVNSVLTSGSQTLSNGAVFKVEDAVPAGYNGWKTALPTPASSLRLNFDSITLSAMPPYIATGKASGTLDFTVGDDITIFDVKPRGINGNFVALAGTTNAPAAANVTALTWAANVATGTTSAPHGIAVGQRFYAQGFTPGAFLGTFTAIAGTTGSTIKWEVLGTGLVVTDQVGTVQLLSTVVWALEAPWDATHPGPIVSVDPIGRVQGLKLAWNEAVDPGGPMTTMGKVMVSGTVLDIRKFSPEAPALTTAQPTRIAFTGPIVIEAPDWKPIASDVGAYVTDRKEFILPRPIVTSTLAGTTTLRVPVFRPTLLRHHYLVSSLILGAACLAGGLHCTQVRVIKLDLAGVATSITGYYSIDDVAKPAGTEILLPTNQGQTADVHIEIAVEDTIYLEFRKATSGTGTAAPGLEWLLYNYFFLPFSDV